MADTRLIRASDGNGEAVRATVTSARTIGSTTLEVDAVTNFNSYFIATAGTIGADDFLTPSTVQVFNGHLSGSDIIIDSFAAGYSDLGNEVGDVVLIKPTTEWANEVADVIEVTHNEDGTLKDSIVTTAKLADAAVTAAKVSVATYTANVSTSGTVTSSSYANFPTNRCYVDVVTANSNAKVLISYTADTAYASATGSAYMRFALSNANTGNATYERRAQNSDASQRVPITYTEIVTLASAGTTRVEVQVRGSSTAACVAENVFLSAQVLQD